jgi:excisionase family DNA binding protein
MTGPRPCVCGRGPVMSFRLAGPNQEPGVPSGEVIPRCPTCRLLAHGLSLVVRGRWPSISCPLTTAAFLRGRTQRPHRSRPRLRACSHAPGWGLSAYRELMTARAVGGYEVMTAAERQFLIDSGAPADSFDPASQSEARARLAEVAARTQAQAAPELDVAQVASLLGCSTSTVRRLAHSGDLYALRRGRELRFPDWQFTDGQRLPGLRAVLAALPSSMHPLSVEGLMTSPQEELDDRSPVEWLAAGCSVAPVEAIADSHAWT